jgi:hypothetical protein
MGNIEEWPIMILTCQARSADSRPFCRMGISGGGGIKGSNSVRRGVASSESLSRPASVLLAVPGLCIGWATRD